MSRPSRSSSSGTRRPMTMSTSLKATSETTAGPDDDRADTPQLADQLGRHVVVADLVGHVVIDTGAAKRWIGEDAGQDRAENAADAMHTKDVERIVCTEQCASGH
jgi:hypothetical protein